MVSDPPGTGVTGVPDVGAGTEPRTQVLNTEAPLQPLHLELSSCGGIFPPCSRSSP